MDYKSTLNLPKTDFPMRGNLPQNEPKRYAKWFEQKVYERMKQNRDGAEIFTLHDGPPYANGKIHIGHALNKVLKDIIVKDNYFQGRAVRFTPGWDCHGLPIEQQVEKKIGKAKKEQLPKTKIRQLCREHAAKFVEVQKEGFKALGVIADWEKPYVTMDFRFEANIYRTLCNVAAKGLLVERNKPVYWSWAERTALAEAEVEYEEKEDYSIYVAFELGDKAKEQLGHPEAAAIVIWTTTPWTLPANVGISLNPDEMYVLTKDGYIVAEKLFDDLLESGVVEGPIEMRIPARDLEGMVAINPLNGRPSRIVLGEHVLMDNGTGAVHTAPGHGEDDYRVGLVNDLEVVMPVDEEGKYDETVVRLGLLPNAEEFVGKHIFEANEEILKLLGPALLKVEKFTHSYPHCWRSHTPLIFRATKQWFISIDGKPDGEEKSLRDIALDEIGKTKFYPEWGRNRLTSMVEGRPDWCISRQRDWGVPIAFFRNKKTGEVILDEKVLNFIAMIFEMKGCDAWYEMSVEELLYPGSGYDPNDLEKVMDILDVWFDSGSTWYAVLKSRNYDAGKFPADLYLEGSDQHRGWFQSSLLLSSAIEHKAPYKAILTHGFTVDEKGEKMSKSKGNVVAPDEVAKKYGSEILRLWVAMSEYKSDLKISDAILKQVAENYRKIRNTFRFLLANVDDLERLVPVDEMGELDRWIVKKASEVFASMRESFDLYDFSKGFHTLNNFLTNELSGIYLDITKDRLYCDGKNDMTRRSSQSAMAMIARAMLPLVAPVITYTADELLEYAPAVVKGESNDVFDLVYAPLPNADVAMDESYMLAAREAFFEIVDRLKKEGVIKQTLELGLVTSSDKLAQLNPKDAEDWFVVSEIAASSESEALAEFEVERDRFVIVKASGHKCPRCWRFAAPKPDTLCTRCAKVLNV
ncbi:isoleucine--tRNA ligase [Hydrogenimonas cancrithermarum]|uniref:Isoleucine--tRNA ligase n=1 Tax=Hydrogenimonas cancrithermarum TaxID=2993563 RepID=A0ABM8FN01_9BACT|nr:isoleucine--tRNA ligase [Hydrogenimonas cancrithermarum]BDY13790.1 isoleucine--tRNA ligase [Hydrogenimonas cancrithermarum]